jgi:hypothetical protein
MASCPPHSINPSDREKAKSSKHGMTVTCKSCGKKLRLKGGSGESVKDEAKMAEALASELDLSLEEAKLKMEERKALPKSAFVFPEKAPGPGSYPIHDESHARNALSRSAGKPEESAVRAAVHRRYPNIGKGSED